MRSSPWRETPLTLGNALDGSGKVKLTAKDRRTHLYVAGDSGSGKSKLLEHMIRQDISRWREHRCGMLVLDPHGNLYNEVMRSVANRMTTGIPIVPIDLSDPEYTVSYDVLRKQRAASDSAIVQSFVRAMCFAWGQENTNDTPRFERWATGLLHALFQADLSLAEAPMMMSLAHPEFRESLLPNLTGRAEEHWQWACQLTTRRFDEEVGSTLNRIQRFRECEPLQLMLGTKGPSFNFEQALDEGWIVLVNCSTEGAWGDSKDADTFATLALADLWTAAAARGKSESNRPFRVIVDEFQRFLSPSIARNLAEARGFGLHLTLATQFPTQLLAGGNVGQDIFRNVMGNARSKIIFSMEEPESLKLMSEWMFRGSVDPDEIKHEVHATHAVGQKLVQLRGTSYTETESSGGSETTSMNEECDIIETTGERDNAGTSISESEHDAHATIYGKELSSRQYRPIDEQLFLAAQKIVGQDERHAFLRSASMKTPVAFKTSTVRPPLVPDQAVRRCAHRLLEQLPFAMRTEEARKQLVDRQSAFSPQIPALISEPTTAKRRLR